MSEPFIGEIKMFGGNFAILGYAFCDGTLLSISQNDDLISLIGTTYGGDGLANFGLPDLRGRIPVHQGSGFQLGQSSGDETVTLITSALIPAHNHAVAANSNTGSSGNPQGNIVAGSTLTPYTTTAVDNNMGASSIGNTGGSQPHDNIMPYQCVNYIIALEGIFPPRN